MTCELLCIKRLGFRLKAIMAMVLALILSLAHFLASFCFALGDAWHEFRDSWDAHYEMSKETCADLIKTIWRAFLRGEKS